MAPEPRHEPPLPHADAHRFADHSSSSTTSHSIPRVAPVLSKGVVNLIDPPRHSELISSFSSVDHPTVLEGIKEINYVLAAHRAGRPALPLPVVEELEEIRSRLLQGFKNLYMSADVSKRDGSKGDEQRQNWTRGQGVLSGGDTQARIHAIRQSYEEMRNERGVDADRVCPRWVSPDSSRVIYGESPT